MIIQHVFFYHKTGRCRWARNKRQFLIPYVVSSILSAIYSMYMVCTFLLCRNGSIYKVVVEAKKRDQEVGARRGIWAQCVSRVLYGPRQNPPQLIRKERTGRGSEPCSAQRKVKSVPYYCAVVTYVTRPPYTHTLYIFYKYPSYVISRLLCGIGYKTKLICNSSHFWVSGLFPTFCFY